MDTSFISVKYTTIVCILHGCIYMTCMFYMYYELLYPFALFVVALQAVSQCGWYTQPQSRVANHQLSIPPANRKAAAGDRTTSKDLAFGRNKPLQACCFSQTRTPMCPPPQHTHSLTQTHHARTRACMHARTQARGEQGKEKQKSKGKRSSISVGQTRGK